MKENALRERLAQSALDDRLGLDELVPREVLQRRPGRDAGSAGDLEDDLELVDLVLALEDGSSRKEFEEDASETTKISNLAQLT